MLGAELAESLQVAGRGWVHAAGALHRLGDDRGDRVAPCGEERLDGVEVVGGDPLDPVEERPEVLLVQRQALGGEPAVGHPVVGVLPPDDDVALGVSLHRVHETAQLQRSVDGLRARRGEEDPAPGDGRPFGHHGGEALGRLVGEDVEGVVVLEHVDLGGDPLGDLVPAVADVAVPEAGERIDVGVAVGVPHRRPLTPHDGAELALLCGGAGEGMQERAAAHGRPRGVGRVVPTGPASTARAQRVPQL